MKRDIVHDLVIIGGGVNGCGIARDAAGRGMSVLLCDQADLGSATSSASTKLIHGGLRYLEHYDFKLVRHALTEREKLWAIAPHIIWPLRFVLPHRKGLRPAWMLRLGLFIYDHLGGRKLLPATKTLRLRRDPVGRPLRNVSGVGFEYSDCWVQDNRLVVLNAADAEARGATILPRTECTGARRENGIWNVTLRDNETGAVRQVRGKVLVNAAGPWVDRVISDTIGIRAPGAVRLVQGSHIVVRRLYEHDRCYIFQNPDGRIFFAIPYENDFTLIGTTDADYKGDPGAVAITPAETDYLLKAASSYFNRDLTHADLCWAYSGVRALYDNGASSAQETTRDYVLALDRAPGQATLLSVFGGKITTYRCLAEDVLAKLAPEFPAIAGRAGWTANAALPGGDFPVGTAAALARELMREYSFLSPAEAERYVRHYGTKTRIILGGARTRTDLGRQFGGDLTEAEVAYLMDHEYAAAAGDVVWRRTKSGLRMTAEEIATLAGWMATRHLRAPVRELQAG